MSSRVLDDTTVTERAQTAREEVTRTFSLDALVEHIDGLYGRLIARRDARTAP